MDKIGTLASVSWERFTHQAWPLLQSTQIPRWLDEAEPWATIKRGTEADDFDSVDGWFDDTIPFQERIQPSYDERTFTIREAEVTRLKQWADSPYNKEPLHPEIWVHGYGDPLFRLYVAPNREILKQLKIQQPRWIAPPGENRFMALDAARFTSGMCAKWEPGQDGWRIR